MKNCQAFSHFKLKHTLLGLILSLGLGLALGLAHAETHLMPGSTSVNLMEGKFAPLKGVSLWYIDTQTKPDQEVIVLLHPNSGSSELWEPQIRAFSNAGFRVIAFDRRSWGKSRATTPADNGALSISEDLEHLMSYLNIKKFNLLGIAGGGFAALDYAADHQENLNRLIVGGSTAQLSDPEMLHIVERIEIPGIRKTPTYFREVGPSYRAANEEGTKAWVEIEERSIQEGAKSQKLHTPNTLTKVAKIQTPTLVIAGDADLLAPPALMHHWADLLPHHQWANMPGIGHALSWEAPELFNQLVLDFLKK
jgi:pimeloyl-ACP methyl ester carboxylesterase